MEKETFENSVIFDLVNAEQLAWIQTLDARQYSLLMRDLEYSWRDNNFSYEAAIASCIGD